MKFFQKLLVVPATAAFVLAPNLNGFAKESVKSDQDQKQTTQNNWLISQVDDEQNKDKDTLKISVTGTRSPRETKNVPASVTVIDKNEIDRRGITDFAVVCDGTNNTGEVIDRNEFVGDIYIKPARSINFIQLNFVAVRSGVEFSEIVGKAT